MSLREKCKKLRQKVQISVPHEIVDIKTSLHDVQPTVIVDNIPCHEHKAKMTAPFVLFVQFFHQPKSRI
jgi:hypothetical protein